MKLFYVVLICMFPLFCFTQDFAIKEHIEASYKHQEDALKEIKLAITKLKDCDNTHAIDLIHRNASEAKTYLWRATRIIGYAREKANDAEKEASKIKCSEAEDEASNAEDYFYDAKKKLSSAIGHLSNAGYGKDLNLVKQSITDAESDIDRTLKKMIDAVNKLSAILEALENCDEN